MLTLFIISLQCLMITAATVGNDTSSDPCGVTGSWVNDLGSAMELTCQPDYPSGNSGVISGRYNSAVGNAKDFYKIAGRYSKSGTSLQNCVLGFTVAYNNDVRGNSHSTASFTGVQFSSDDTIYTHWVLVYYTRPEDMWQNSHIGKNVFTRRQ